MSKNLSAKYYQKIKKYYKKDNTCFQYAVIVMLNYEEIGKYSENITKIKPFINKYKSDGTNFSSEKGHLKILRKRM